MTYIPTEDVLKQYEQLEPSISKSYKDYLQGAGISGLQAASNLGANIAQVPSDIYSYFTGKEGYKAPRPNLEEYIPESEYGQLGKNVGQTASDLIALMLPGRLGVKGLQALNRYHPLTQGQMGRQLQGPMNAAEQAGVRAPLSPRDLFELDQLLSHPELQAGGRTGRAITPLGRQAIIEGASEGRPSALFSGQSNLGYLERAVPGLGEGELASTRIRPLKERILEGFQTAMRNAGLKEEADNLQQAREASRRYYKTRSNVKNVGKAIGKPLSVAALIKAAISGAKSLP